MSSRSDNFTLSTADLEPDSIDRLVIERIRREVRKAERELKASVNVVSAIRGALHEPRLTPAEVRAHQRSDQKHSGDPIAAVLSERVGAALAAGLRAACADLGIAVPVDAPAVLVLRGESGSSGEKVDSQVSTALAEVKARLIPLRSGANAEARTSDTSRLFVLAHRQAFDKLRQRLPPGFGGGNRTIVFYPLQDTAAATDPITAASEVEVVRVEGELAPVEKRVLELLRDQERGGDHDNAGADGASPEKGEEAKVEKDPLIGQLFHHKYRIVSKIGTGGFGSVYEAKDERGAGNRVAIKILRPEIARTVGLSRTFKNEARRATRLSHPNIVDWKVFDETEDGTQYFVMELVEGEEMDRVLSREGPLPPARVANILLQILDALRVAHHLGEGESILHLDLKPRNVFLVRGRRSGEEKVKVIDFGIGQYIGGEEEEVPDFGTDTPAHLSPGDTTFNPTTLSFVRSGEAQQLRDDKGTAFKRSTACTPEYASPEQCVHVLGLADMVPLDGRSDLYSLGVMGFQMLTGHLPFGRPLVRSDMLRLHMQKPPKKVGSMGVRVPRNLARFIDRCLAKDRDQRFKDTNEAHEVMHKIVHPPVWQTVAKIVAPLLVVIVVALVGWATKVGARPAAVALKVVDQDLDLARDSLYMGPSRPIVELALAGTHEELPANSAALRVVNTEGGQELEGWRAEWLDAGRIRLSRIDEAPGRVQARARIAVADDAVDLTPFPLTWLGANAWKVDSVRVGETSLDELGTRAIDPVGQSVDLWISGDARAELADVSMQVAGRGVVLTSSENQGDRVLYRRALDDRGLTDGPCELSIVVRDRAGRSVETKHAFAVATEALDVTDAKLVTRAGGTDGVSPECILFAGRYSIMPRTEPRLALTLNRHADVTYSIVKEGKEGGTPPATEKGLAKYEIPLSGIAELGGGAKYTGSIHFDAHDDAYVLHAAGSTRGTRSGNPIVFSFSNVEPNVLVKLKDSKGRIQNMLESEPVFTNELEPSVVIERKAQLPTKIVVSYAREGDGKPAVDRETDELVDLSQYATVVPLRCAADGFYKVRVQAFQVDSTVDARADRPDLDFVRMLGIDTTPPVISLEGFEPGSVITREHGFAPNMMVVLAGDSAATGSPASPVEVSYDLTSRPSGGRLQSKVVGSDLAAGSRTALVLASLWSGEAALSDGAYELTLRATDGAGNAATPRKVEFVVALSGPTLSIQAPLQGGRWQPNADRLWQVQLRGSDPNGVERAECMIVRDPNAVEGLAVPLTGDAHASPEDQVFVGGVALTDAWSDAKVWIRSRAWDLAGTASEPDIRGPFTLPLIEPPRPDVIEAQRDTRTIGRMRHVVGNSGFLYVFGGQGDAKENKAFKEAGLPSFNKNAGQSRELSWQIEYEPNAIDDFYLDEQEVTVGEFLEFVRADKSGYSKSALWPAGSDAPDEARRHSLETELAAQSVDTPIANVTWEEASAYARWIDKRLPSWVEWEFATRGGQQYRAYASFDPANKKLEHERANVDWEGRRDGKPWARGLGRDRTSDTSLWNLAGNVAEWTSSPVYFVTEGRPTEDLSKLALKNRAELRDPTLMKDWERCREFWIAGGSFESSRCDFSFVEHRERTAKRTSVGFRCAASLKDVQKQLEQGRYRDATQ